MVPSFALGLHLLDCEFKLCLQYWLGLQLFSDGVQFSVCHTIADPHGDNHVGCRGNGDRILRHNALHDAIFSAAQSAALAPQREVPSLTHRAAQPISTCQTGRRGTPPALDVFVISTLQQATIQGAATTKGHVLLVGEAKKLSTHADACQKVGVSFIPMVIETFRGPSAIAISTLACLGHFLD